MNQIFKAKIKNFDKSIENIKKYVSGFRQVREAHRYELIHDYVELISHLTDVFGTVRQVDIVVRLGVSQPTVAKMLKKLIILGLIKKSSLRNIFLTHHGVALALKIKKRHRIVESFLLALGVSLDTARRDTEGIEHHVSDETLTLFRQFVKKIN